MHCVPFSYSVMLRLHTHTHKHIHLYELELKKWRNVSEGSHLQLCIFFADNFQMPLIGTGNPEQKRPDSKWLLCRRWNQLSSFEHLLFTVTFFFSSRNEKLFYFSFHVRSLVERNSYETDKGWTLAIAEQQILVTPHRLPSNRGQLPVYYT